MSNPRSNLVRFSRARKRFFPDLPETSKANATTRSTPTQTHVIVATVFPAVHPASKDYFALSWPGQGGRNLPPVSESGRMVGFSDGISAFPRDKSAIFELVAIMFFKAPITHILFFCFLSIKNNKCI